MNARALFRIVVWLGIAANWSFGIWVLFFDPHKLLDALNLGQQASVLWLYNYSVLLMILSLFYIPAASDPFRYRMNAWLLVAGRLVPASTFVLGVALGYMPQGFLGLFLADGTIGVIELLLLLSIYRRGPAPGDYGYAA